MANSQDQQGDCPPGTGALVSDQARTGLGPAGFDPAIAKHTPGPWQGCLHLRSNADETCGCGYRGGIWSISADVMICEMGHGTELGSDMTPVSDRETQKADARLIAAAPELLDQLRTMVAHYVQLAGCGDCGFWDPETEAEVIAARAAIAKAEGR